MTGLKSLTKRSKKQTTKPFSSKCRSRNGLCKDTYQDLIYHDEECCRRAEFHFERRDDQQFGASTIRFVEFASNGRYLACIEVNSIPKDQNSLALRNLIPVSQLLLLKFRPHQYNNENMKTSPQHPNVVQTSGKEDGADFEIIAAVNLNFIEVYCMTISNDTTQIAVYGFTYNEMPRKPIIHVYEITSKHDEILLAHKAKISFDTSDILSAKVTAFQFLPKNDEVLVTSICDDYHSIRKTNYLDLWNTYSNGHIARFELSKVCPRFQGYVSSKAFSSDGIILAMLSSTRSWQLLLYNVQENKFGKIFSFAEHSHEEPFDHFYTFCAFTSNFGEYELLVCTSNGELSRLVVDAKNTEVECVIYSKKISQIDIIGFKYCPMSFTCIIKTIGQIQFIDIESSQKTREILFSEDSSSYSHLHVTSSKTGREIASISNDRSIAVFVMGNCDISLKNHCRNKIIGLVAEDKIPQLDLPTSLIKYILFGKY